MSASTCSDVYIRLWELVSIFIDNKPPVVYTDKSRDR